MIKFPKRVYNYLGDADFDLNTRATARCPSCCAPAVPSIPEVLEVGGTATFTSTKVIYTKSVVIDATRYFVAYQTNSSDNYKVYGVVCTFNPDTLAVTIGTPVQLSGAAATFPSIYGFDVVLTGTNRVIVEYYESSQGRARVLTIAASGTTFTVGAVNVVAGLNDNYGVQLTLLETDKILFTYNTSSTTPKATVLTVTGDTVTPNAVYTGLANTSGVLDVAGVSSTRAVYAVTGGGAGIPNSLKVISVAGTVVTWETPTLSLGNPVFQGANTETYTLSMSPNGVDGLITARSLFEDANNVMMRAFQVSGATVTSNDASEYVSVQESSGNTAQQGVLMSATLGFFVCTENGGSNRVKIETVRFSNNVITVRDSATYLTSSALHNPFASKLSWSLAAYTGTSSVTGGNLVTGIVKVT